jgi:hypothetical protein
LIGFPIMVETNSERRRTPKTYIAESAMVSRASTA